MPRIDNTVPPPVVERTREVRRPEPTKKVEAEPAVKVTLSKEAQAVIANKPHKS